MPRHLTRVFRLTFASHPRSESLPDGPSAVPTRIGAAAPIAPANRTPLKPSCRFGHGRLFLSSRGHTLRGLRDAAPPLSVLCRDVPPVVTPRLDRGLTDPRWPAAFRRPTHETPDQFPLDSLARLRPLQFGNYRYDIVGKNIPSVLPPLGSIRAFKKGTLVRDDQISSILCRQQLEGHLRRREDPLSHLHR